MTSGRLNDAVQSLLDWLAKAEIYLAEDQPILGDLDTVNVLIEKHKVPLAILATYTQCVSHAMVACTRGNQLANQTGLLNCVKITRIIHRIKAVMFKNS